jgi:adenylate cyclase
MRIPISTKIILLVTVFLLATTAFFAIKSSALFESVLVQREEENNLSTVTSRMKEVDATLLSAKERVEVIGTLIAKQSEKKTTDQNTTSSATDEVTLNFNKDKTMVSLEIYKISSKGVELVARRVKQDMLAQLKLPTSYIDYVRTYAPFPILSVAKKNIEVLNSSFAAGPPLVSIGVPVLQDEQGNVSHVAVADLVLGILQKPFSEKSEHTLFLTDKNGVLLAHQDEELALARKKISALPIVDKALKDPGKLPQQTQYTDPESQKAMIGAYAKSPFGVVAFSQIEKEKILEPAKAVQQEAIYIAGTVISIALFFSFLFSMSLTSPIEKLAEMIEVVSKGNFNVKARTQVHSNDEVGDLATAFDHMTEGLKERDKVKNLFSKFHGSSIAEDLIKNDIGVGGQNKEVTIFFSDIRGFTAFSEKRTPEEVVAMLNEYFATMVGIINQHGGVVDKFIGDAIMAVWGAPKGDPNDTLNAMTACIQMRKSLLELNNLRETREQPPILIGMGLHCGRAISGTIGSQERMEYTVIGDTVNLTSRIEASTKAFGADLLVSQAVVDKVNDHFVFELGGSAEVKGQSEPLRLFKVRGLKNADGTTEIVKTPYSDYEKGDVDKVKVAG